jgi:CelD/BcsL family acetyltransferase involved in cellulose biosynthesis
MEVRRPGGRRRWVSLPFSDECAPLCPEDSTARFLEQVDARRRAEGVADLEVRTWVDPAVAPSQQVAVTHELDLHVPFTTSGLPARARASVRHDVAAAHRRGLRVTAARTVEDVVDTYYRLHLRTRRRHGVPAQPRNYFRSLWENVLEPGDGLVLIARAGDTPVAGAVLLVGGSVATYKYSASDPNAWSLHPNHAVLSAAITWARERGCATFDFGRTDADNPGLRKFKESWGAQTRPLYYTSFGGRVGYRAGGPAHSLLASVIRRSPPAVCRGLGRLLYRYAA